MVLIGMVLIADMFIKRLLKELEYTPTQYWLLMIVLSLPKLELPE